MHNEEEVRATKHYSEYGLIDIATEVSVHIFSLNYCRDHPLMLGLHGHGTLKALKI